MGLQPVGHGGTWYLPVTNSEFCSCTYNGQKPLAGGEMMLIGLCANRLLAVYKKDIAHKKKKNRIDSRLNQCDLVFLVLPLVVLFIPCSGTNSRTRSRPRQ